jgi:hypothetical protein
MVKYVGLFLLSRLKEPTTYKGIFLVCAACGMVIPDELGAALTFLFVALAGGVDMLPDSVVYKRVIRKEILNEQSNAINEVSPERLSENNSLFDTESKDSSTRIGDSKIHLSDSGFNDK